MTDMPTEKFGRYEIKGELGRGGMASVFHAYDPRFERDVAIKVLPREFLHDPQFRARFEREAKMVALLEHPAIVPVYDFGEEEGQPYIVMRYMSGGSLADKVKEGSLPVNEVVKMISRLAPALDAAHSRGIIHRDLKPGNILYDQYGNAFLSDFGIARLKQSTSVTLTGGAILGTPAYMSPEQVQGGMEIDGRSDIYALGVILFQVLAGKTPYNADTAAKLMMMHILEPVPSLREEKADLPPAFDDVIEIAMAKDPDDRFQTSQEMAEATEEAAKSTADATRVSAGPAKTLATAAAATRIRSAATVAAPAKRRGTGPSVPPPAAEPVPAPAPKAGVPVWAWIAGAAVVIIGGLAIAFGGSIIVALGLGSDTPTPAPSATAPVVALVTEATPTPVASPTPPPPSDTPEPTAVPVTDTPVPTETPIPPTPTETPTPLPVAPVIGGADKMAFLRSNEVWVVNLDGTELTQLTSDGGRKNMLQWSPDGSAVIFISGLCVRQVQIESGRIDDIVCLNSGTLELFQISPDGSQIAISVFQQLFITPYDPDRLSQVDYWTGIRDMAICEAMKPYASSTGAAYIVQEALWSSDMQHMAVLLMGAVEGRREDVVYVLDISHCDSYVNKLDEFPAQRFTISGYSAHPDLEHLGWNGNTLFAMIGYVRNEGFGDLHLYDMDLHRATMRTNPVGSACCYRDPGFGPNGDYLAFAFQDIGLGENSSIQLYYISVGSIGTGMTYTPIPLPDGFFTDQKDSPQPALRPAVTP